MADFILEDFQSWPSDLLATLAAQLEAFTSWNLSREDDSKDRYARVDENEVARSVAQYERAIAEVSRSLANHRAQGFHCTKLTGFEVQEIRTMGMALPNSALLERRLSKLEKDGFLSAPVATRLRVENEASDTFRKNMLWFCFHEPLHASQGGIERFFRSWGGEALYNAHERDEITGTILLGIGTPCIVEAWVPLSSLRNLSGLADKVGRRFCVEEGQPFKEPTSHQGPISSPLPADCIISMELFPSERFRLLTGCDEWKPELQDGHN